MTNEELPVRLSSRVVLLDSLNRVLLLEHLTDHPRDAAYETVWVPPGGEAESAASPFSFPSEHTRVISSWVKQEVFKRDQGRCVLCGSTERLHFDHELPFSKGGVSVLPENIRILCAEHNLRKGARIE